MTERSDPTDAPAQTDLTPGATASRWVIALEAIDGSEDLLLPLPDDLLARMGWGEGDTLQITLVEADPPYMVLKRVADEVPEGGAPEGGTG